MEPEIRALLLEQSAKLAELTSLVSSNRPAFCSLTFRQLWDRYLLAVGPTWTDRQNIIDMFKPVLEHFADRIVGDLQRRDWIVYRAERGTQRTRMGGPPAVGTRNLELRRAKTVFRWAMEEGLLELSPVALVKPERGRPPRETLIPEDGLQRFLLAEAPMLRAYMLLGVDTGMRKSEIRLLRWSQIKANGTLTVSWTVNKTKRSRPVALTVRCRGALHALDRIDGCDWIFVNPDTLEPWSDSHLWKLLRQGMDAAGLEAAEGDGKVRFHDARHQFVTSAIERGTPPPVAMRAAGHTTFAMASRYFHLSNDALLDMRERNDAAISAMSAGPRRAPRRPPAAREKNIQKIIDG